MVYADVMKFIDRIFANTLFEKERVYGTSLKNPEGTRFRIPFTASQLIYFTENVNSAIYTFLKLWKAVF